MKAKWNPAVKAMALRWSVNVDCVGSLRLMTLPSVSELLLGIAVFVAILLALTRSYRDSEMTVWFASGLSIAAWVKPVLQFALPVAAVCALLSLVLSPWSQAQSVVYQKLLDETPRGQEFLLRIPAKRFGQTNELVGAAIFLASDAASFVNGEILAVDGGFLASGVNQ